MQLLERESQLLALNQVLSEVQAGEGRIALVYGEAGIGKTSLVELFTQEKEKTWRILRGACDSLFTPRPLGPLHDIALQTDGSLLTLLSSESNRAAIFSACLTELKSIPTILVIEDIHWADEATLDLLKYLGRRIKQTKSLLILTYRDDELGAEHPLRLLLGDLVASGALYRVPVPSLSKDAVRELARGKSVDVAALHRLTNGNAFFVTEVLAGGSGIPESVRDAVLSRATRLSPGARRALETAAVIGLRVESWLLSSVSSADAESVQECVSAGMLRADGDYYVFRHELARQTILESTLPQRKIELHRLTLAALEESPKTRDDLARLTSHAEGTGDAKAVLQYAPPAARHASAVGAHREAATLYMLALRFAARLTPAEHARILEACAFENEFMDPSTAQTDFYRKAIELWRSIGEPLREGANLADLATLLCASRRNVEAEEVNRKAISILEALPPSAELARAYKTECYIQFMHRNCSESIFWGRKAVELAERVGDIDTAARSYNYLGCAMLVTDYEKGEALLLRGLAKAREAGSDFAIAGALRNLVMMPVEVFQFAHVDQYLKQGIAYATEHDDDYHLLEMLALQAMTRLHQGYWTEAEETARRVLQNPEATFARVGALIVLGGLRVRRGEPGGQQALDEAYTLSLQEDMPRLDSPRAARAEAAWLNGDNQHAIEEASALYGVAESRRHPWITGGLAFWRWRAGETFTPPEWIAKPYALQIAGDWREAANEWKTRGCPYEQAMALMDGDEAAQLAALEIFERLGARPIIEKLKRKMRLEGMHGIPRGPRPSTRENAYGLTARELDVLSQLVEGSSNNVIAKQFSLSTRTVEHHIASILQKTGVQSRGEVVALALRESLVPSK